jgi:hypothetical protein
VYSCSASSFAEQLRQGLVDGGQGNRERKPQLKASTRWATVLGIVGPIMTTVVVPGAAAERRFHPQLQNPSTYAQAVLADRPVAYWPLDETTGPAAKDTTGHGFDGQYRGGIALGEPGPFGSGSYAASFDGSSSYVWLDDPAALQPNHVSVEAWINTRAVPSASNVIIRKLYYGYVLWLDSSGKPVFGIFDSKGGGGEDDFEARGATLVADGKWHYLVAAITAIGSVSTSMGWKPPATRLESSTTPQGGSPSAQRAGVNATSSLA